MATPLLSVMGASADFERTLIREHQTEDVERAKRRGIYPGRRPSLAPK